MYYFYILKGNKSNWYYIGSTTNLRIRFIQHNRGEVKSTKSYKPLELVSYEAYTNYSLANKRELNLKKNRKAKEDLLKRLNLK